MPILLHSDYNCDHYHYHPTALSKKKHNAQIENKYPAIL